MKSVSIRFPDDLLKKLHYIAKYEGRSLNQQILYLVTRNISVFEVRVDKIEIIDSMPEPP